MAGVVGQKGWRRKISRNQAPPLTTRAHLADLCLSPFGVDVTKPLGYELRTIPWNAAAGTAKLETARWFWDLEHPIASRLRFIDMVHGLNDMVFFHLCMEVE